MSRIFLSYAKEDGEIARRLYADLRESGLCPWLDIENLMPGTRWRNAIKKAIEECDYFVALLSSKSVNKRGYVQKEIRQALETLEMIPEDQIFIVPVRLDECKPGHPILEDLHWLDLFPEYENGLQRLLAAVGGRTDVKGTFVAGRDVINVKDTAPDGTESARVVPPRPYRVLVIASNPQDTARIRVDLEAREISAALGVADSKKVFQVKQVLSARIADLRQQLLEHRPQLVHISSHGSTDGVVLEDGSGRSQIVGTRTLRSLIHLFKEGLECVVLNASFSDSMAEAISDDVPYVVGISGTMPDEDAIRFSTAFYESIAAGKTIEFAYSIACTALALETPETENAPRLFRKDDR